MLRIEGDVDPVGRAAVESLLQEQVCAAVEYRAEMSSTNSWALDDLRGDTVDNGQLPKLYLVDCQCAGRGRHGRTWVSTSGTLTFSIVSARSEKSECSSTLLPLAVGLGVARCVEFEFAPLQAKLKWPNDVYIDGGKLAGILLETSQTAPDRVVIGVGVNVANSPESETAARSLAGVSGRSVHRYSVLPSMIGSIIDALKELPDSARELVSEYRSHCLLTGQRVRFQSGSAEQEGLCKGITDRGELAVVTDSGEVHVRSGEARLVRRQPTRPVE